MKIRNYLTAYFPNLEASTKELAPVSEAEFLDCLTIHNLNGNPTPTWADYQANTASAEITAQWKKDIAGSDIDLIPRWLEDHLAADHGGITADPVLQQKYTDKKAIRNAKP
jgi:hypothetical protein